MSGAIVSDLKKLEDGIVMCDSTLKQNVLVFAPVIATLADNPRQRFRMNRKRSIIPYSF